jgi:hypothetical protein
MNSRHLRVDRSEGMVWRRGVTDQGIGMNSVHDGTNGMDGTDATGTLRTKLDALQVYHERGFVREHE